MNLSRFSFLFTFLLFSFLAHSQAPPSESFSGFQDLTPDTRDEISPEQRQLMFKTMQDNIATLAKKGIITESVLRKGPITTKFGWPLRKATGFNDPSYYGISNFVDVDVTKGKIKDFNCGTRTYDGHMGTDIFTVPFWWKKMDENSVEIVAAAAGIIVGKSVSVEDKSCAMCPAGAPQSCFNWNFISVQHADGSIAIYGHMKKNSPTSKVVGDPVSKGEYLGVVGSSGSSSGPHLHFEVWENNSFINLLLPWAGTCNPDGNASMWDVQQPYYNPQIIKLMTGTADVQVKACYDGGPENTFEKNEFTLGDTVYITSFFRDHRSTGSNFLIKLVGPDNKIIYNFPLVASSYPGYWSWLYYKYKWGQDVFKEKGTYKYSLQYGTEYQEVLIVMKEAALPLNLLSFSAKSIDENVLLSWQTSGETNTTHFEIEHGTDGDNFEMIGKVNTSGNDRTGNNDYSLNDYNPASGMNFYRLKMVDKDGKFTYSNIEKVNIIKRNTVRLFPNPATNIVTLQGVKNYTRVKISNLQGAELMSKTFAGDELKLNISNLPAGVYLLQLGKEVFDYNVKLIKK